MLESVSTKLGTAQTTKNFWQDNILRLINFGSRLGCPKIVALGLRLDVMAHSGLSTYRTSNAISLSGYNFSADIASVSQSSSRLRIGALRRSSIKNIATAFFSIDVNDNNFYIRTDSRNREAYKKFLIAVWQSFDPVAKIKIVLTGNFGYWAERELGEALSVIGVKLIVLHKENVKPPAYLDFWKRMYRERRGVFTGHSICVYNEMEKAIILESGAAKEIQVHVTGMPRLDSLHEFRKACSGRGTENCILYGLLTPKTYMPIILEKKATGGRTWMKESYFSEADRDYGWFKLAREALSCIVDYALRHPNVEVIIKSKGSAYEKSFVDTEIKKIQNFNTHKNVNIVHGGGVIEMIARSKVICAFNSTIIFEGIACGKPVIVPNFSEASDPRYKRYQLEMLDGVLFADNQSALTALIDKALVPSRVNNFQLTEPQKSLLKKYLHNEDGGASKRVAKYLESHL